MWSDRRFDDFSTFGRAEKVSVFKGFRLFSKILRRERWWCPERSALPSWATPRCLLAYYSTVWQRFQLVLRGGAKFCSKELATLQTFGRTCVLAYSKVTLKRGRVFCWENTKQPHPWCDFASKFCPICHLPVVFSLKSTVQQGFWRSLFFKTTHTWCEIALLLCIWTLCGAGKNNRKPRLQFEGRMAVRPCYIRMHASGS